MLAQAFLVFFGALGIIVIIQLIINKIKSKKRT
jgi:hypothetical protein